MNKIHYPYLGQDILIVEEGGPDQVSPTVQVTERSWIFDPETFDVNEIPPAHDGYINAAFQHQGGIEIDVLMIGPNEDSTPTLAPGLSRHRPIAQSTPLPGLTKSSPYGNESFSPVILHNAPNHDLDQDFFGPQAPQHPPGQNRMIHQKPIDSDLVEEKDDEDSDLDDLLHGANTMAAPGQTSHGLNETYTVAPEGNNTFVISDRVEILPDLDKQTPPAHFSKSVKSMGSVHHNIFSHSQKGANLMRPSPRSNERVAGGNDCLEEYNF